MRTLLIVASLAVVSTASAQRPANAEHAIIALPDKITYTPAPDILPPGAQLAVLDGNPAEAGPYTMRLRMPAGYRIPPHFHPAFEHVTVLRGSFKVGMGEKFDTSKMTSLPAGTFAALAPGVRHFAQAQGETLIQLHGTGPWTVTYVNPADDPRHGTP